MILLSLGGIRISSWALTIAYVPQRVVDSYTVNDSKDVFLIGSLIL